MNKTFILQKRTNKQLIRNRIDHDLRERGKFLRFCNFAYQFLFAGALAFSSLSVIYCLFYSGDFFDWFIAIAATALLLLLALLAKMVVFYSVGIPYRFYEDPTVMVEQGLLIYAYEMTHNGYIRDTLSIHISEIEEIEYNEDLQLITVKGVVHQKYCHGTGVANNICSSFEFFNCYDEDVFVFLKNNVSYQCKIVIV